MNTSLINQGTLDTLQTSAAKEIEIHPRTQYQTIRGVVWTQPRTITVSEGVYRLEFVFDDDEEIRKSLLGLFSTNKNGEIIVYSYSFKDYSKFDMRGRLIS
ncbi:hypothetical protein [Brevibacillus reuszeri]|uniref:hypothetical protein n=1 Tax=Brevibacillus reuszeri TaxID=54915 RepID=UPI000CCC5CF1|nr:hypothetical protein [Brevibacillus reuszeri]